MEEQWKKYLAIGLGVAAVGGIYFWLNQLVEDDEQPPKPQSVQSVAPVQNRPVVQARPMAPPAVQQPKSLTVDDLLELFKKMHANYVRKYHDLSQQYAKMRREVFQTDQQKYRELIQQFELKAREILGENMMQTCEEEGISRVQISQAMAQYQSNPQVGDAFSKLAKLKAEDISSNVSVPESLTTEKLSEVLNEYLNLLLVRAGKANNQQDVKVLQTEVVDEIFIQFQVEEEEILAAISKYEASNPEIRENYNRIVEQGGKLIAG